MIHEILPVGLLHCNCSILGDPETREALVLDPGDEVDRILAVLSRHGLAVRAIVSTHAHIDHVGGLSKVLQQATSAPVLMHGDDLELYRHLDVQAAWIGMRTPETAHVDQLLREGDTVRWGRYAANVLHTPGRNARQRFAVSAGTRRRNVARAGGGAHSVCRGHTVRRKHRPYRPVGRVA